MSSTIHFDRVGLAHLVATDGHQATLHCDSPAPPGTPLSGVIVASHRRVQLKVRDCRRIATVQERFQLSGRWVSLSRVARDELLGSLADAEGD